MYSDPKIVDWLRKSYYLTNTCIKCGKHFDKGLTHINLHSKDWDKDNMYNETMSAFMNECHQRLSLLYGYGDNTEEQF